MGTNINLVLTLITETGVATYYTWSFYLWVEDFLLRCSCEKNHDIRLIHKVIFCFPLISSAFATYPIFEWYPLPIKFGFSNLALPS